jgi:hypothetical protein
MCLIYSYYLSLSSIISHSRRLVVSSLDYKQCSHKVPLPDEEDEQREALKVVNIIRPRC